MAHSWQHAKQMVHETAEGAMDEHLPLADCPAASSDPAAAPSRLSVAVAVVAAMVVALVTVAVAVALGHRAA